MAIKWTPNLSVGVDFIDEQHKIWFEKADQLFSAGQRGEAKEYILQMFDFLEEYTNTHFRDEEEYMASINYPELDAQKKAHATSGMNSRVYAGNIPNPGVISYCW